MGLLDFFKKDEKKTPSVKGYSFGGMNLSYDISSEVYYKFYDLNPYVYMAINKRSNDAFSKGWEVTKNGEGNYDDEFEELIKTSTSGSSTEFLKRLVRDYDITGNAYTYIVKDEAGNNVGLQVLDPRYVKPIADKYGQLLGYIQNLDGIKVFLKDEIFHIKNDNDLDNEIVGKSRMKCLFADVEIDQEARDSNLAFFKNNQTPSSIILIDPDFEIDEENQSAYRQKIKDMFEGGKYTGGKNHHRSMMAQGIKDVIKIQDKISDMEYKELRIFTGDIVFGVYETPRSVLGFTNGVNYNSGDNQYDTYWDNIEALGDKFSVYITKILKEFDPAYEFTVFHDNLRKLASKAEIAGSLFKDKQLITRNEARELIQYEDVSDGDEFSTDSKTVEDKKDEK